MTDAPTRRTLLALAAALPALAALPAAAQEERALGDVVLGDPDAPLTVIEYASFTCPHCAAFHNETFPEFEKAYVETGKVNFILREVYFDPYGLWASMLARCNGEAGFYPLAEQFLKRQESWAGAEDVAAELQRIGRTNGMSTEAMRACLSDQGYAEELVARYQRLVEEDGIQSTPSFVIAGEVHRGNMSFEELSAIVDRALEG